MLKSLSVFGVRTNTANDQGLILQFLVCPELPRWSFLSSLSLLSFVIILCCPLLLMYLLATFHQKVKGIQQHLW